MSDPPDSDVLEVSIFGPGKGESALVHLGDGDWIIVDSCINSQNQSIPALEYLKTIGVDPAVSVHFVVGTHAHDDHVRGISTILEECKSALFVSSAASTSTEMKALAKLDELKPPRARVLGEFARVYDLLTKRGMASGVMQGRRALEQRPIWLGNHKMRRPDVEITCLSPSDRALQRAEEAISAILSSPENKMHEIDPNELAVALWIEARGKSVLLGADLLIGPEGCGWRAVLATHFPIRRASVFKIPHHGSPNAHHAGVWTNLLGPSPIALIAPFRGGHKSLPSNADVQRIAGLTPNGFVTAPADQKTTRVRRAKLELGSLAMNVRDPYVPTGFLRVRSRFGQESWTVEGSAEARAMSPTNQLGHQLTTL